MAFKDDVKNAVAERKEELMKTHRVEQIAHEFMERFKDGFEEQFLNQIKTMPDLAIAVLSHSAIVGHEIIENDDPDVVDAITAELMAYGDENDMEITVETEQKVIDGKEHTVLDVTMVVDLS